MAITGIVQSSDLEKNLKGTIMYKYSKQITNLFVEHLKDKKENIFIPTLNYLLDIIPGMREDLIDVYNGYMGIVDGVENIPDSVKAVQGALLDGLCFGYEPDGNYALYTMNFGFLDYLEVGSVDMCRKCMAKNKIGEAKGFRIDVEYVNSSDTFEYKAVNCRKPVLDDETTLLVPYIVVVRLMLLLEKYVDSQGILRLRQNVNGTEKERFVSSNVKILSKYCDEPSMLEHIKTAYFPLKAFFYVPVIGAPSTTAMTTRINLFDLYYISSVTSKTLDKYVEKPVDPVRDLLVESVIISHFMKVKSENPDGFARMVTSLPNYKKILSDADIENMGRKELSAYLHSISREQKEQILNGFKSAKNEVELREKAFGKEAVTLDVTDKESIKNALKISICRFVIRKKDCTLSAIMGTNDSRILSVLYGRNYYARYESFGARFSEAVNDIKRGTPYDVALRDMGFNVSEELLQGIKELESAYDVQDESFVEALKKLVAENEGVQLRASSSTDSILLRTVNAYIDENGTAQDYYRYLDPSKIVACIQMK